MQEPRSEPIWLIYDGDCPFCSRYVKMIRLRQAVGDVQMVDARSDKEIVRKIAAAGYDLNEGMVLVDGDDVYHGDDCIHRLALMSTGSNAFNRLNALIFRSPQLSRVLYPVLKRGRLAVLFLLRRSKIDLT